jgi:hypothetical protein
MRRGSRKAEVVSQGERKPQGGSTPEEARDARTAPERKQACLLKERRRDLRGPQEARERRRRSRCCHEGPVKTFDGALEEARKGGSPAGFWSNDVFGLR